jgi:hypothetical protein
MGAFDYITEIAVQTVIHFYYFLYPNFAILKTPSYHSSLFPC